VRLPPNVILFQRHHTSGLTFEIASYGDLKIDGTATTGAASGGYLMIDTTQTLEIGSQGALTITAQERNTAGTLKLDGGTISDQYGIQNGANVTITGFGTINADLVSFGLYGAAMHATGGVLIINGDLSSSVHSDIASNSTLSLQSTVDAGTTVRFLDSDSGTLELGTATVRQSFETNGIIGNMNVSTNGAATNVLDLADVASSSITSAMVANGNTIELFNGSTMIDHFSLASSVGTAAVHPPRMAALGRTLPPRAC
jgi:hypothetical protein